MRTTSSLTEPQDGEGPPAADPVIGQPAGRRSLTSHHVAKVAGVSQSTVSRVLRNDVKVSPATRERVVQALAETGYELNAAARAFRTHRTGSVGVVIARLSNQIYPAMLGLIGARLASLGQRMIVWDGEHGGELQASHALRQGIVDGVILTATTSDSAFLREVDSPGAAVVLLNRTVESYPGDQVSSDNFGGGGQVARYLLGTGRRRIALIGGLQHASTIRDRERGFRQALDEAGTGLSPQLCERPDTFSHASGQEAAMRLLSLPHPPDGIFCVNDVLALGAIDGARALGARIPEDVWVVGYDDIELASWGAYDLTTVRQPIADMVAHAIDTLLSRIENRAKPLELKCFSNELVIRGSTGHAPLAGC